MMQFWGRIGYLIFKKSAKSFMTDFYGVDIT